MDFKSFSEPLAYERARQIQLELVEQRLADQIPDTVLFLEHRPVITRGKGLQFTGEEKPRHMPLPVQLPAELEVCETERGGDLTYHGPGQLVIYPICKLDGKGFAPERSVGGFLRKVEGVLIQALSTYLAAHGVQASSRDKATGVWIGSKKIASMGIAVKNWVTYHGIAINVVNDLAPFSLISPCGFSPDVMTRLKDWAPIGEQWREELEGALKQGFLG